MMKFGKWTIGIKFFHDSRYAPLLTRSGVELVVNFQHSFFENMGIDLRGGDIGMAQHLLDGS